MTAINWKNHLFPDGLTSCSGPFGSQAHASCVPSQQVWQTMKTCMTELFWRCGMRLVRLSVMNSEMPLCCAKKSGHQGLNAEFWDLIQYWPLQGSYCHRAGFTTPCSCPWWRCRWWGGRTVVNSGRWRRRTRVEQRSAQTTLSLLVCVKMVGM